MLPYNRSAAVLYAHLWAMGRNPPITTLKISEATVQTLPSQVLYAGAGVHGFSSRLRLVLSQSE